MAQDKVDSREYWESCFEYIDAGTHDFSESKPALSLINFCNDYLKDEAVVLDLGCGGGRNAHYLAEHGYKVYGLDISKSAVEFCERRLARFNMVGVFKQGTFDDIPFSSDFFSSVICVAALDHVTLETAQKAIIEIRRVLIEGGLTLLTFDSVHTDDERLNDAEVLSDGTLRFIRGKQKGMLFRRYRDDEIVSLLGENSIISFNTSKDNTRIVVGR